LHKIYLKSYYEQSLSIVLNLAAKVKLYSIYKASLKNASLQKFLTGENFLKTNSKNWTSVTA